MAKKTSTGATRRTAARTKADLLLKNKIAPAVRPARIGRRPSRPQDPKISSQPVVFDADAYKFVLAPPPAPHFEIPAYEYLGELPDSYGTRRLYLVARDPHFLFAYWDFSESQFIELAHRASDGNVYLQVYLENGDKIQQIHLGAHSKHWYINSNRPDTTFYAEIGIYHPDGRFEAAARSGNATAPRDTPSARTRARFVTLPFHVSFRELLGLIQSQLHPGEELAEGLARLQEEGFTFPFEVARLGANGSANGNGNGKGVDDYLGEEIFRRIRVGSFDITEVLRRRFDESVNTSSGQWPNATSSMSSPFGASFGAGKAREFFMHVNAELIIYGGTDPKAKVRINGENIQLREDGTFSFHFNFPDGQFHIPIEATSPDEVEKRGAFLSFLRMSDYSGEVVATPQTPRSEPIGRVG